MHLPMYHNSITPRHMVVFSPTDRSISLDKMGVHGNNITLQYQEVHNITLVRNSNR